MAEYIERGAAYKFMFDIPNPNGAGEIEVVSVDDLESIPAADVVPVRHGRWDMLSYDEAVCTCCGYDRDTPFESTKEARERWGELPPFCEMCGARMEVVGDA